MNAPPGLLRALPFVAAALAVGVLLGNRPLVFAAAACLGAMAAFVLEHIGHRRMAEEDVQFEIFIPSDQALIEEKLRFAGVRRGDVVLDLGAGDGRVVIAAAKLFGALAVGVEGRRRLARQARRNASAAGVAGSTSFHRTDFMDANVGAADVLILYLTSGSLAELESKLEKELKPGARVVTHDIPFPNWFPTRDAVWNGPEGEKATFYMYERAAAEA